ncbi:hypothetical protein ACQEU8_03820 [Streptomyces sp. CA-250714]|uniref:hypothetical protein n=1 Tax=Streptomyces sp. CA-250714 TaxID=3240060 RepID=UPI003D8F2E89
MTDSTVRSQGGVPEGAAVRLNDLDEGQHDARASENSPYWDALNKFTMSNAMALMSAGWAVKNSTLRTAGFGLISAYKAEKSLKELENKQHWSAGVHAINSVGAFVWAAGTGLGDRGLKTAGPAINSLTNAISAAKRYYRGEEGWREEALAAGEMGSFAVANRTGSPVAAAAGFGFVALEYLSEATKDRGFLGHGAGALVWCAGAGLENDTLQSIGAGALATAEFGRLLYSGYESYTKSHSSEATPQQPSSGPLLPVHNPARTAATSPGNPVENALPVNPVASAASLYAPSVPPLGSPQPHSAPSTPSTPGTHIKKPDAAKTVRRHSR